MNSWIPNVFVKINNEPTVINVAAVPIAAFMSFVKIRAFLATGASDIYLSSGGSSPNIIAANVSIIKLIQRIIMIENTSLTPLSTGTKSPNSGTSNEIAIVATLTVNWNLMNF